MRTQNEYRLENLKQIAYDSWVIFRHMNLENESFKAYIELIDAYLGKMRHDFQFTPSYISEYHKKRMEFWNPMKVKLFSQRKKEDIQTFESSINKPDIYFTFKHRNLLLEIIQN